jgi:hypothetical protein
MLLVVVGDRGRKKSGAPNGQLQNPKYNEWSAKLFNDVDFGPNSSGYQTALRIAQIPDDHIRALVGVYGPESREENDKLADTVIARRDAVARAY